MKKWVKDVMRNKRTFRLTFYEESINGLWHCVCEEIYHKKKNIFDIGWKGEVFEFYTCSKDVINMALERIDDIFTQEKDRGHVIKSLDEFVNK